MKKLINNQGGYTIVELVVTIIVGAILVISVSTVVNENAHLSQKSRDIVSANSFVEGKIEALRSVGYSSLIVGTSDITSELPIDLNSPRSASLQISIPEDGIKKADLTLSYNDQGSQKTYSYSTYIGELGVGQY